jgi:23S rRNA pseudouridine2604 synthase
MNIELDVPVGKWRHLTDAEVKGIFDLSADSTKTEEGSL